jgi:hypothetical protein
MIDGAARPPLFYTCQAMQSSSKKPTWYADACRLLKS